MGRAVPEAHHESRRLSAQSLGGDPVQHCQKLISSQWNCMVEFSAAAIPYESFITLALPTITHASLGCHQMFDKPRTPAQHPANPNIHIPEDVT